MTITGPSGSDLTIETEANTDELVFTTANWDTAQEVKVTAAGDDDSLDDSHTISHAIKVGSAPEYLGVSVDSVSVTVDDDDDGWGLDLTDVARHDYRRHHDILPSET